MNNFKEIIPLIPKAMFTFSIIFFYIYFGGLKGNLATTLLFGIIIGLFIGREFYNRNIYKLCITNGFKTQRN